MIDFMVIGLPRSGTAWAANLFTTDVSLCWHESFIYHTLNELDQQGFGLKFGIAETSAIYQIEAINAHSAPKLIIERSLTEINDSLKKMAFPLMPDDSIDMLSQIEGYRIQFKDLFDPAVMSKVCRTVFGLPFNIHRFNLLCDMNVQNHTAIELVREMV